MSGNDDDDDDECRERRLAEIEFVTSAYSPEEAWCCISNYDGKEGDSGSLSRVNRRLRLEGEEGQSQCVLLILELPRSYPELEALRVSAEIEDRDSSSSSDLRKLVINSLPAIIAACRLEAEECQGDEAVFVVFSRAEAWMNEDWKEIYEQDVQQKSKMYRPNVEALPSKPTVLGRRLIYSHHLISKTKRSDIKRLSSELKLTGYMKIGWPGLVIIEGEDENCNEFYDTMRRWAWKYLVVRGEQQEKLPGPGVSIDYLRKFSGFQEVEDMSIVAESCREAGLEALFRTSMKVYDNGSDQVDNNGGDCRTWYAALVHVHHMNNDKAYRKFLRSTGRDQSCDVVIRQCHINNNSELKPKLIVVGIIGEPSGVSRFLKEWRITRVDVTHHGRPCLERMMTMLIEGEITLARDQIDWNEMSDDNNVSVPRDELFDTLRLIGGEQWAEATERVAV